MRGANWLTATEARARLGVRAQTLYAYVSRGQVRAEPDPADPRRSLYRASDIAALSGRKARGRRAAAVAAEAIAWGEPVLASAITTVKDGRLYYRGRDAVVLAESETFEAVARLLRGGAGTPRRPGLRAPPPEAPTMRARLFLAFAARAATDAPAWGRPADELADEAASLLDVAADAVCGLADGGDAISGEIDSGPIHERLGQAWGLDGGGMDLVRRALVLLADHELNASTFAARVAASTGAALSAATLAGLASLSGPLHGGMAARVGDLAAEAEKTGAREAVAARLAHWKPTPGFGHPLYPEGDPRARALFGAFQPSPAMRALREAVDAATGEPDNVDFALLALAQSLALPPDAPFIIFALARCAGWLAHAMEQALEGALIRPRARYVGPAPGAAP